ncbi:hypothetical protein DRQ25_04690 [Candidatus Fermentibacteria bacterium]|nr:MAG: hypothetical protein DRQ25_04690 [Candidatus Fermentibacteria bacterium]
MYFDLTVLDFRAWRKMLHASRYSPERASSLSNLLAVGLRTFNLIVRVTVFIAPIPIRYKDSILKYKRMLASPPTPKEVGFLAREIVNAKYVINKKRTPPIKFVEALNEMKNIMPAPIVKKIHEIIAIKATGKEKKEIQHITEMDGYINAFLEDGTETPTEKPEINLDTLNTELRRIILKK